MCSSTIISYQQQYIHAVTYHRRNISDSKIKQLMQIFQRMLGGNFMWMKRLNREFIQVLCTSYIWRDVKKWNINALIHCQLPSQVSQHLVIQLEYPRIFISIIQNIFSLALQYRISFQIPEIDSSCHVTSFRDSEAISLLLRSSETHCLTIIDHQYKTKTKIKVIPWNT